jgi:hypothetical protein
VSRASIALLLRRARGARNRVPLPAAVVRASSSARGARWDAAAVAAGGTRAVLHGLPGEVLGILRRHWAAAVWPAALLGLAADGVTLLHDNLAAEIATGLLIAVAFEVYVGYAELIVAADRGEGRRPPARVLLRRALPMTVTLVAASVIAVSLPLAASGLLVIPGLWLMTRWALFAPAIVHEGLGARAALARSSRLVRGAFWAVALTATLSVLVEHGVIHATAHTAEPAAGSLVLGLIGAAIATAAVSGPAAFTISVVYERLLGGVRAEPAPGRVHHRPDAAHGQGSDCPASTACDQPVT